MCILDLSKTLLHDLHFGYIKNKYDEKAKLLFVDTDSLAYEIETSDVYKIFYKNTEMFDFSDTQQIQHSTMNKTKTIINNIKDKTKVF